MSAGLLEILTGDLEGRRYEVDEGEFTIGRAASCDIVIPKKYISRTHARIVRDGDGFVIDGLSEKNPVRLGDRPIREHPLRDGDVFELCGIRFRFRLTSGAGAGRHARSGVGPLAGDDEFVETDAGFSRSRAGARKTGKRGAPADDSWSPAPVEPLEDDWSPGASRKDAGPRASSAPKGSRAGEDDDSWAPAPARGSVRSSVGGVVFEVDDEDEASGEQTGELPAQKLSHLSSRGGGATESENERTAALGAAVDRDDPDYDPFAALDNVREVKKERDPQTERLLRIFSVVGLVGILIAVFVSQQLRKPVDVKIEQAKEPLRMRLTEARLFEVPWRPGDRPFTTAGTRLNGVTQPQDFLATQPSSYVEIEWLAPHVEHRSILLLRAVGEGETTFELRFPSHRVMVWTVVVEGSDPHQAARDKRREELRGKSPRELQRMVERNMASGDTLTRERDSPGKEGYYRQALELYQAAFDAADALGVVVSATGDTKKVVAVRELIRRCDEAVARAEADWDDFIRAEEALYQGMVGRNEPGEDCVFQLRRVLRGIGHTCDVRYKRLFTLLRECWGMSLIDPPERCEHDTER